MDKNQNSEAMTPQERPPTGALLGDIFRALTEHGFGLEQQVENLRNGNRALQYAQRHAEEMHGKTERDRDALAERLGTLEVTLEARGKLLYEMWAMLCNSGPDSSLPTDGAWQRRFEELRDAYHAMLPTLPAQADAEPQRGADPTCTKAGHLTSSCEHAPDGGNHPTAPSAGFREVTAQLED